MRNASAPILLLLAGCVHTHPVGLLQRDARKQDREWTRDFEEAQEDGRFWVHRTEALAVAAEAVAGFAPLVRVDTGEVVSDWVYGSDAGIDETGEWHTQTRDQARAVIDGEHELGLSFSKRNESRRLRAGLAPAGWAGGNAEWTVESAQEALAGIEAGHLARPRLEGDEARLRRVAIEKSPKGYAVSVDEPGRLVIERYDTQGKASKNGKKTASWHSRSRIELLITSGGVVDVQLTNEHRFDVDNEPGEWQPSEVTDRERARGWVKRLLADPRSGLVLAESTRDAPASIDGKPTEPPKIPRLRTMPELQQIIANQAIETSTGDFRICLTGALTPSFNPAGGTWDVDPAAVDEGPSASGRARTPAEVLGEPSGRVRTIGTLPDLAKVQRDIPVIEDFASQAALTEQAMKLEKKLPGFTPLRLPSNPDITGRLEAGARAQLHLVEDRMVATWSDACIEKRFKGGLPTIQVELFDQEEGAANEAVSICTLDLVTVLSQGDVGVTCGETRIFFAATYLFDMPQIEVVGLPPVRE